MTSVAEIQQAILTLPKGDFFELQRWLDELFWQKWDQQIEGDSKAGRLDVLAAKALETKRPQRLQCPTAK